MREVCDEMAMDSICAHGIWCLEWCERVVNEQIFLGQGGFHVVTQFMATDGSGSWNDSFLS